MERIEKSIEVRCPVRAVYNQWTQFEEFPRFMTGVKEVRQLDDTHQHWHVDVSYVNVAGTFYYLCSVIDGFSRAILAWEVRASMKEDEVEIVLQEPA